MGERQIGKRVRGQTAVEYLSTYGWAVLIIAVVAALIYEFIIAPSNSVPTMCSFTSGVYCRDAYISSNSAGTYTVVILSNAQQYPIANPVFVININNLGNVTGSCSPGFVPASAAMVCNAVGAGTLPQGAFVYSNIYLKEMVCATGSSISTCTGAPQTLQGYLDTHVQQPQAALP